MSTKLKGFKRRKAALVSAGKSAKTFLGILTFSPA
jgi:hypothetical protein